jgi:hypothetical protein
VLLLLLLLLLLLHLANCSSPQFPLGQAADCSLKPPQVCNNQPV